mgnify:CR=1 FL=1
MEIIENERIPFNQIEKQCRAEWLSAGSVIPQAGFSLEDMPHSFVIGKTRIGKVLEENDYFEEEQDVACSRHPRYFPPVLHHHHFFEAVYVVKGSCVNFINGTALPLTAGDLCILAPDTIHALSVFDDEADVRNIMLKKSTFESAFLSLMKDNDLLSTFFRRTFFSEHSETPWMLFHTGADEQVQALVLSIYREANGSAPYKRRMLSALISMFFITLIRDHENDVEIPAMQQASVEENFMFMMLYLQEHFATVTLSDFARLFNYSERQIQRIVKQATGLSFIENVQKLRMERAAQLLTDSKKSIASIAEECGYASLNNFRAIFRHAYGMSPQDFRAQAPQKSCAASAPQSACSTAVSPTADSARGAPTA